MLKEVIEEMWEELHDAKKYVKCAIKHKDNSMMFEKYMELASDEMTHFNKLHDMAVKIVDMKREQGEIPTSEEMIIYNYEHEKAIEKANEIRTMMEIAKK